MTPARFSGAVVLGSEPRPQIAKETSGKSRETQSSKFIWEQIFPNAKTSYVGYGLGGGEVARSSPWTPVTSVTCVTLRAGMSGLDVPTTEAMG